MSASESPDEDGEGYFASISDLMVGILFVFLLMLTVFALNFREAEHDQTKARQRYEQALSDQAAARKAAAEAERRAEQKEREAEIEKHAAEDERHKNAELRGLLRKAVARMSQDIEDRQNARLRLLQSLEHTLKEEGGTVILDPDSGVLRLPESLLFEKSQSTLGGGPDAPPAKRQTAQNALKKVSDALASVLPCYVATESRAGWGRAVTQVAVGQSESRKALADLRAGEARWLPETSALVKAIERLGAVPPAPRPDTSVLDRARRNLVAAADSPGGLAAAERRDFKFAPWLLWTGSDGIAGLPGIFDILFQEAERLGSVRRSLVEAWIANCDANHPTIETCGSLIELLLGKSNDARIEVWRRAQARFHYFRVQSGPARVASAILNGTEPVPEILKAAGLDEPVRATSGYARLVNSHLLRELPSPLAGSRAESVFERAQAFAVLGRALRFEEPEARGTLANSLLTPWAPGSRLSARDDVRSRIQSFLLERLGDPRTKRANWLHVEESKIGVMRRWLSRASLKARACFWPTTWAWERPYQAWRPSFGCRTARVRAR